MSFASKKGLRDVLMILLPFTLLFAVFLEREVGTDTCVDDNIFCTCCLDSFQYVRQSFLRDELKMICTDHDKLTLPRECGRISSFIQIMSYTVTTVLIIEYVLIFWLLRTGPDDESRQNVGLYLVALGFIVTTYYQFMPKKQLVSCLSLGVQNATCVAYDVLG